MKEESKDKLQESMAKEVTDQFNNGNFTVIPKSEVPKGQTIQADEKKAWCKGWIDQEVQGQIEHWRLTNEKRWTLRQKIRTGSFLKLFKNDPDNDSGARVAHQTN